MKKESDASIKMGVYDGDTSKEDRMWLRDNARLVFFLFLVVLDMRLFLQLATSPCIMLKFLSVLVQLITNPDMLHMSILPFHRQFSRILSNLR